MKALGSLRAAHSRDSTCIRNPAYRAFTAKNSRRGKIPGGRQPSKNDLKLFFLGSIQSRQSGQISVSLLCVLCCLLEQHIRSCRILQSQRGVTNLAL